MAKVCPVCGTLRDPVTREVCKCGHEFASRMHPVLAPGQLGLCPSCGRDCAATARSCVCGYGFDEDPEQVRHMLMHGLTMGWFGVIGGALMAIAGVVWITIVKFEYGVAKLAIAAIAGGSSVMVLGAVKIARTRKGLELYKQPARPPKPPKATVVKR